MSQALIDKYTEEELRTIVSQCKSVREIITALGYKTCSGNNHKTVKNRIEKYQIDISHFSTVKGIERNPENVFIEHSTASQKTLRDWYVKGNYTEYICSICGQLPEWQGKPLTLILDHINGHNKDDRLENLRWVCPNCNQQLDTTNGKNIKTLEKQSVKQKEIHYCEKCGIELKTKEATRCPKCAAIAQRLVERPSREELKSLIRTLPFTTLATQFGVSDNAIRKWCVAENLPKSKREIQSYSDEDWELL